jgi:UDP-N-acetylglucosamine 1-carboxyvinyltransferase
MNQGSILVKKSPALRGEVDLSGAKNAVLVTMLSLLLTSGKSVLKNVPWLDDVYAVIDILKLLGAEVVMHKAEGILEVDTTNVEEVELPLDLMRKARASVLAVGPLLARCKRVRFALPGGCVIGARPIDFHIKNFKKMGVEFNRVENTLIGTTAALQPNRFVLEYPSVGTTENILMAAVLTQGTSYIVHAAIEPEILDLIVVLRKMGANITLESPAIIKIIGVERLMPVEHFVMYDRLEAGALLLAGAITQGDVYLPQAMPDVMEVFLMKLQEMGHQIDATIGRPGVRLKACARPQAVSFKTGPYPGFPTDLQSLMLAVQAVAQGKSTVTETVFENRFMIVPELQKLGAAVSSVGHYAYVEGVRELSGAVVQATDIRASCALALAGFVAEGTTEIQGLHHWLRGYHNVDQKLRALGADIQLIE